MTVHAYYDQDDRQLMVGCCDGAHEVLYPLDDPEAVARLLAVLAKAGVLDLEPTVSHSDGKLYGSPDGCDWFKAPHTRYVSEWKEAK